MKRIKKFAAALLTAIMMMTMTVTAYAAETTGTLTVNVNGGQTLANQTVNVYKLFDMTVSGSGENLNYGYKVNETYKSILNQVLGSGLTDKSDQGYYDAVQKATDADKTQGFANDFTKKLLENNKNQTSNKINATATKTFDKDSTETSTEFEGLGYGYYLVCQTGTKAIQSSLVALTGSTASVDLKSQAPYIKKKADKNTVFVGETVTYTVTGQVPDTTGYDNYIYKIHDTLTSGLDFVTNTEGTKVKVTVKIGDATVAVTEADFVSEIGEVVTAPTKTMVLDLSEKVRTATVGQSIEVTYHAKVNKDAVVETKNSATLEYSNKPGTNETGTTKPSEVVTPTYPLDINKTSAKDKKMLAGAHFTLYGSTSEGAIDKNNVIKVTKDAEGKYTYASDQNATENTTTDMVTVADKIAEKGNLHINGLAAGTYYLEETKAPDGFNKLTDPIKVIITKITDAEWTISKNDTKEDDKIIDIENSTGSLLPSTGGTGVIVFAGVAILLVFGVVVSFIRDKRKAC
mgnify:CR=1 FL=1